MVEHLSSLWEVWVQFIILHKRNGRKKEGRKGKLWSRPRKFFSTYKKKNEKRIYLGVTHVEIREQPAKVDYLYHNSPQDTTIRLSGKYLCQLSHLTSPNRNILIHFLC